MTKKLAWSEAEDARLTNVIKSRRVECKADGTTTINASWGEIAELMPQRSAKQCRERWCYNLNPAIKRAIWTAEEDAILVKAQTSLGNQWALIARHLPGRTENSVKTRHKSIVRARKRAWSEEEDQVILSVHRQIGSRWDKISTRLPGRTPNGVKTRYSLLRKGLANLPPVEGSPEQILFKPELVDKVKLEIPSDTSRRPKRNRNYFTPLLNEENENVKGTVNIILEEMVENIALKHGERKPGDQSNVCPVKKRRVEAARTAQKALDSTNATEMSKTEVKPSNLPGLNQANNINSLLQDSSISPEVRNALLAQSQQLMMYSNAFNTLALQQRQHQQQQQLQQLATLQNQLQSVTQQASASPAVALALLQAAMNPALSSNVNLPGMNGAQNLLNAAASLNQRTQAAAITPNVMNPLLTQGIRNVIGNNFM